MIKRVFDVAASLTGLILCAPLFVGVACLIKLASRGPIFFRQERMGRWFQPFLIYKFRTMIPDPSSEAGRISSRESHRLTSVGRWLRRTKLDELPQLINVFKGEMSLVGPRPELRTYVERFREDYVELLAVQPGMTDLASLKYRDEERILARAENPEEEYLRQVLPDKIRLAKEYIERSSFFFDIGLILRTFFRLGG